MSNIHNDVANHYYSGQGVVMIGQRDSVTGQPKMLLPLGNVSDLKIQIATSVIDHKGSQDGQRAIDKRLQTEAKCTASMTLENWVSQNLATALRGNNTLTAAGAVTATAMTAWGGGAVNPLPYINVTAGSMVLTQATTGWVSGAMTEWTSDTTPWDFKMNADAGSFRLNNGTELAAPVKACAVLGGTTPTGTITTGSLAITSMSLVIGTPLAIGDTISLWGVTGAGGASVNGIAGVISAVTMTGTGPYTITALTVAIPGSAGAVTLSATTTLIVPIKQASTGLAFPQSVTVAYSYSQQNQVDALTLAPQELYLRFEGLNTAEANNGVFNPMVIEIFRFASDPLKELAMISDTFGQFVLEGAVLADALRPTGTSKYFNARKLN